MIKVISKSIFYEDKIDSAINLYKELVEKSKKEKGCISYNLYQDIKDNMILTMIEEWESEEALIIHQNTEHFKKLIPIIGTLRKSSELNLYEMVL